MSEVRRALLHPITIGSIALLIVNDHVLKRASPGVLTGKLSDVAGMAFLPLVVAFALGARRARAVAAAAFAVAAAFTAVKLSTRVCDLYATGLGALQWLLSVPSWTLRGVPLPSAAQATVMRDPTDLVAVPFVAIGPFLAWREGRKGAQQMTHCAQAPATHIGSP